MEVIERCRNPGRCGECWVDNCARSIPYQSRLRALKGCPDPGNAEPENVERASSPGLTIGRRVICDE